MSWFAAQAYCESEGARLPTWTEWEYVAAADRTWVDARSDPAWLARILGWYARPASTALPAVGGESKVFGVRDVHGLVWEWVDDFNALHVPLAAMAAATAAVPETAAPVAAVAQARLPDAGRGSAGNRSRTEPRRTRARDGADGQH